MEKEILMYFDGASKSNGGPSGAGFWVDCGDTSYGGYKFLGNATNNEAEYNGLLLGLKSLVGKKDKKIKIHGDSKLIIEQMKCKWKINAPNLKPLWEEAQNIIKEFNDISFVHIDRSLNSKADTLANIAVKTKSDSSTTTTATI